MEHSSTRPVIYSESPVSVTAAVPALIVTAVAPDETTASAVYVYYRLFGHQLPFGTQVFTSIAAVNKKFGTLDSSWVLYPATSTYGHRLWTKLIARTATAPAATDVIEECIPAS